MIIITIGTETEKQEIEDVIDIASVPEFEKKKQVIDCDGKNDAVVDVFQVPAHKEIVIKIVLFGDTKR